MEKVQTPSGYRLGDDAYSQSTTDGNEKKGLTRSWSFTGLAIMMRITLMYYADFYSLSNHPEKDWETLLLARESIAPGNVSAYCPYSVLAPSVINSSLSPACRCI